jgi:hypothetical protein
MAPRHTAEMLSGTPKHNKGYDVSHRENICLDKLHSIMSYSVIGHEYGGNKLIITLTRMSLKKKHMQTCFIPIR